MSRPIPPHKIAIVAIVAAGLGFVFARPRPRLVWNASASAPVGLYRLDPDERLYKDELVLAQPPRWAGQLASTRGYLPLGVPLIKHVVALPGDCVCARASAIIVNGSRLAGALSRDHAGRVLPRWTGCNVLDSDRLLLLNATVRDSFDGRYFGISRRADVLGRLEPLWLP